MCIPVPEGYKIESSETVAPEYQSLDWYILYIDNLIKDNPNRGKFRFSRQQLTMFEVLRDHLTLIKNDPTYAPISSYILKSFDATQVGKVVDFIASFK